MVKLCPACGAKNGERNSKCILCSRRFAPAIPEPEEEFFDGPVEFEPDEDLIFDGVEDDYEEEV